MTDKKTVVKEDVLDLEPGTSYIYVEKEHYEEMVAEIKQLKSPWRKDDPEDDDVSYIVRLQNGFIQTAHWRENQWYESWQDRMMFDVKDWMKIPHNEPNREEAYKRWKEQSDV